ncbi:MAG: site-specific integrase [Nitrospirae bacterium]|nr:MAG: site-specific integrase [Nitrospirota bacterium]
MSRPRGQDGWVEQLRGGRWKAHWYVYERVEDRGASGDVRRHRSKTLGRMTKGEATAELRKIIARECGSVGAPAINGDSRATFAWFWVHRFEPLCDWSNKTKGHMEWLFTKHIEPRWGTIALADIDGIAVSDWLKGLAEKYSESLVKRCRTYLKAALGEAVEEDFLRKNPMRRVGLPKLRKPSRPVAAIEQLQAVRRSLKENAQERDVVMFDVLVLTGMRPCEMLALRWEHFREGELYICQAYVETELKETKTDESENWVAIPQKLSIEISRWKKRCPTTDWMFPNLSGRPYNLRNWRKRVFRPAAAKAGVQMDLRTLRRTWATLAHDQGAGMKSVQAQLRHASSATTNDVYVQPVPETVRSVVEGVAKRYFLR